MLLLLLAYLGGVLTIVSPCILPVIPFVFSRADRPFRRAGLPLLAGMAVTFAAVASLVTVGGGWAVRANEYGRIAALVLFAIFGVTLIVPSIAERLARPLVRLGSRLARNADRAPDQRAEGQQDEPGRAPSPANSFVLGIATGLLWAPCAGPILGLILTGAALAGASVHTGLLLLAYALGAATSLGVVLFAGGRIFAAMKRSLGVERWVRRGLGVAVLAAVVAVSLGLDRGILTQLSLTSTNGAEQHLVSWLRPQAGPPQDPQPRPVIHQTIYVNNTGDPPPGAPGAGSGSGLPGSGLPAGSGFPQMGQPPQFDPWSQYHFSGATAWINSPPLTGNDLRGKVVLVDFWTYSCINCLRTLPYVKAWYKKYKNSGFVVIGVHTPEFPFEKSEANVKAAVHRLGIKYPVAMDNNYVIWRSFNNQYWPADYFMDAYGRIRFHHFGEGSYAESEKWIRELLKDAHSHRPLPSPTANIAGKGVEEASDWRADGSPETYIGYQRAQNFASPGGLKKRHAQTYQLPQSLKLNEWGLEGRWKDEGQIATLLSPTGSIVFRFHARDLNLVLGPGKDGAPVRFRITIDGKAPGADHGVDTNAEGYGAVTGYRLYQMVRQQGQISDRTFKIEFLDTGVRAYSFTFG